MTTIVKIGTESLKHFETSQKVNTLVRDIAELIQTYKENVLLVTSGAVAFGRNNLPHIPDKHILATSGWTDLLSAYKKKFDDLGIHTGGILATHADIEDHEEKRKHLITLVNAMWQYQMLPIVNENDALSAEEMNQVVRGADNDKNALLLAKYFHAKNLIIISNTRWVLADLKDPNSVIRAIDTVTLTDDYIDKLCGSVKSTSGTGGMRSKLMVAREASEYNIRTVLCDGVESGVLDHYTGKTKAGTEFFTSEKILFPYN